MVLKRVIPRSANSDRIKKYFLIDVSIFMWFFMSIGKIIIAAPSQRKNAS